jgi:hypothetical protein
LWIGSQQSEMDYVVDIGFTEVHNLCNQRCNSCYKKANSYDYQRSTTKRTDEIGIRMY